MRNQSGVQYTSYPESVRPGFSRRHFLELGACASVAAIGARTAHRPTDEGAANEEAAVVHVYLPGGLSHLDTFDMKPNAPSEIRGEFRPIATSARAISICEHLPRLANLSHHCSVVRGVGDLRDQHSAEASDSGYSDPSQQLAGGRPGIGAVLARCWQPAGDTSYHVPVAMDLTGWTQQGYLPQGAARGELLAAQSNPTAFSQSSHVANALTPYRMSESEREQYGVDVAHENISFLRARRLLDIGVRYVGLSWGYWDHHGAAFPRLKRQLPMFDAGLSALIDDLAATGRLEKTLIIVSSEFGRSPTINNCGGRDHWTSAMSVLLAGGLIQCGTVVGATDSVGAEPRERRYTVDEVLATIYQAVGIDARRIRLADATGQVQRLLPAPTRLIDQLCVNKNAIC